MNGMLLNEDSACSGATSAMGYDFSADSPAMTREHSRVDPASRDMSRVTLVSRISGWNTEQQLSRKLRSRVEILVKFCDCYEHVLENGEKEKIVELCQRVHTWMEDPAGRTEDELKSKLFELDTELSTLSGLTEFVSSSPLPSRGNSGRASPRDSHIS